MRILLCTTALGYGGAETHVIGLAAGLVSLGHDVTVASGGGELAAALPAGVIHVLLPAFSRTCFGMLRSSAALKRLVRRRRFDVVHAHARIPALLCRRHAKKFGCRFVVTAHALFRMTGALRRLSVWGERTIAVSEDIKQLLIDRCGVYPGHIAVIPNGIDTNRFSPRTGRASGGYKILFVSRMDTDCSLAATLLCRIAGRLAAEYPGIKIILTGGGSEYERIRAHAEGINAACGADVLEVTGGRADIEILMRDADIFVGVSRAALEAAACCLPVVLAGNEGYSGILSPENTPEHNNFCGRGDPLPDSERLYSDIIKLLDMDDDGRRELGDFGRRYVIEHHSSLSSAAGVETVYRSLPQPRVRGGGHVRRRGVLVCGYYGFGNAGDNAVLDSLLNGLAGGEDPLDVTVMTARPRACRCRFGVRCIGRTNIIAILLALLRSSHFILGGGTLIQNATSPRSLRFYLFVSHLACITGCKLIIYGSGLGPIYGRRPRKKAASLLARASLIGLRESSAYDMLRSLGVNLRSAAVYADPALLMTPAPESRIDFLMRRYVSCSHSGTGFIAISLRESSPAGRRKSDGGYYESRLAAAIDGICDITRAKPLFFILSPQDKKISERIRARLERNNRGIILPCLAISDIIGLLSRCRVGVGMRLHMLVFAAAAALPVAGIACDPKIGAFLEHAGLPAPVPADISSPGNLISLACRLSEERDFLSARMETRLAELRALAQKEIARVRSFIYANNRNTPAAF